MNNLKCNINENLSEKSNQSDTEKALYTIIEPILDEYDYKKCDYCNEEITNITFLVKENKAYKISCINCIIKNIKDSEKNKKKYIILENTEAKKNKMYNIIEEYNLIKQIEKNGIGIKNLPEDYQNINYMKDILKNSEKKNFYLKLLNIASKDNSNDIIKENEEKELRNIHKTNKSNIDKKIMKNDNYYGYNPKRDELENEFKNEEEDYLVSLKIKNNDSENEKKLKEQILNIYNKHLKEREINKRKILNERLLNFDYQKSFENTLTEDELNIYNCLKTSRKSDFNENDLKTLLFILMEEKRLGILIEKLKNYKSICNNINDINIFESEFLSIKNENNSVNIDDLINKFCGRINNLKYIFSKDANEYENKKEKDYYFFKNTKLTQDEFQYIEDYIFLNEKQNNTFSDDLINQNDYQKKAEKFFQDYYIKIEKISNSKK